MARNKRSHKDEEDILIIEEPDLTGEISEEEIEEKVQEELNTPAPEVIKTPVKKLNTKNKTQGLSEFLY